MIESPQPQLDAVDIERIFLQHHLDGEGGNRQASLLKGHAPRLLRFEPDQMILGPRIAIDGRLPERERSIDLQAAFLETERSAGKA